MLMTFEQLFLFLSVYIPLLLTVAFFVLFESKFLASVQQHRVGPKIMGWKVLFPFAFSFFVFIAGSFCFFDMLPDNSNNLFTDQYDLNKILYPTYSKTVNMLGSFFFMYKKNLINFVYSENLEFFLLYYLVGVILLVFFMLVLFRMLLSNFDSSVYVYLRANGTGTGRGLLYFSFMDEL